MGCTPAGDEPSVGRGLTFGTRRNRPVDQESSGPNASPGSDPTPSMMDFFDDTPTSAALTPRWVSSTDSLLTPSAQRMRGLAQEMSDEGNTSLAACINRAADTVPEPQLLPEE